MGIPVLRKKYTGIITVSLNKSRQCMLSQTEKSIHLSEKCTEKQDRMSMMTDPTGHNTTENRVWDGMAYRILPTIPKSREEVHNNILIALSGT